MGLADSTGRGRVNTSGPARGAQTRDVLEPGRAEVADALDRRLNVVWLGDVEQERVQVLRVARRLLQALDSVAGEAARKDAEAALNQLQCQQPAEPGVASLPGVQC